MLIYVDESGDLGWSFAQPYGRGGSSRYLTIAAMVLPETLDHLPTRKVKQLYTSGKWDYRQEKKWVDMPEAARSTFVRNATNLRTTYPIILYKAIVVYKKNVAAHLRSDSNKLYNYMLKLLLLDEMKKHARITLIPDPRSIKVESGNCLQHYLEMSLYEEGAVTQLETLNRDSKSCLNLQFVDMLAGVVGTHYEFRKSVHLSALRPNCPVKQLFFGA
ncbi:DUF3800 domain-containing protein [Massilia sp. S19_KUP03_FR1]|uniref:DUF3800 domain-containing protein n=1 Tax=Massilia sp. S19_KUP03_FR1 TaxID=3025503 RepID=UPI002FCD9A01